MATVKITPTYIGDIGDTGVYRVDLSQFGLNTALAITIYDDNILSGGSGGASGFDLDFVKLSSTLTSSASTAAAFANSTVFDFGSSGVLFQPGFLQTWVSGDYAAWNTSSLFGTSSNVYSSGGSTLGTRDALFRDPGGVLSLGEGGQVTLLFNFQIATAGQYLYIGDGGGGNDGVYVTISEERAPPSLSGVTLTGTSGNDTINLTLGANAIGAGDDIVNGLGGNDVITTGSGTDRITGGSGNDTINGGGDTDTAVYSGARAAYTINTIGATTTVTHNGGSDGVDTLTSIEFLAFTDQTVAILNPGETQTGASSPDVLVSSNGDDVLSGGDGNDYLYARDGIDTLYGGNGIDVLLGEGGNDVLVGDAGQDYMFGGNGNDTFYGGDGVDVMNAGLGDDLMFGGAEGDFFYGEGGNNSYYGGDGNDIMVGDAGDEIFNGEAGNDYVYAGSGNDVINGGDGVDVLQGQGGNDIFDAGPGVDYLFLGAGGNDTVIVNALSGVMVVNDFTAGTVEDVVRLQGTGITNFQQVQSKLTDYGSFSILTIDSDTAVWFIGVSAGALTAADFLYA